MQGGGLLDGALPDLVLEMGYQFTNRYYYPMCHQIYHVQMYHHMNHVLMYHQLYNQINHEMYYQMYKQIRAQTFV